MTSAVVEADGLSKQFGTVSAVAGFNLILNKGEMLCLVGPDGAGKSTTVRMLSGIVRPTSGTARVFGYDLLREADRIKKRIGYMSQGFTLYGDLTVDENIEFFAEIHEVKDYQGKREELLAFTRLEPFRKRLAEKLSGGMKQKMSLACTLIHTPNLLLLDEPTTGVDAVSRREFWAILRSLLETGITILMTSPYMDEAERADRVALMDRGSIVVVDTPSGIRARMKRTIIELICDDNRRAAAALKGLPEVLDVQAFGDKLHLVMSGTDRDVPALERRLIESGIRMEKWRPVPPSLENVFIFLTRKTGREP
ncbi:MAG: ABC transporter ATP-binding protein [Candidatus Aminicenantes bacterium]|nr:ABC transporter ATP-binding protein [Candidatus Aminicenantes bacterium]